MNSLKPVLHDYFDRNTLRKGWQYYTGGRVSPDIKVVVKGKLISGIVRGTKQYITSALFREECILNTTCSCPIGGDCKHAAALLYAFSDICSSETEPIGETGISSLTVYSSKTQQVPKSQQVPKELPQPNLPECDSEATRNLLREILPPADVRRHLTKLAELRTVTVQDSFVGQRHNRHYQPRNRVAYVAVSKSLRPQLRVGQLSLRKGDEVGYFNGFHLDNLSMTSPPAYATEEDLAIAELWRRVNPVRWEYDDFGSSPPELFSNLLVRIIATNRCFLDSEKGTRLIPGRELPGIIKWAEASPGHYSLELHAQDGERTHPCLDWTVPWYVDATTGVSGPVKCNVPADVLNALRQLRSLTKREICGVPLLLAELNLTDLVPLPPVQDVLTVVPCPPVPQLTIVSAPVNGAKSSRLPLGVLSFDGGQDRVTSDEHGQLTLHKYDTAAEHRFRKRLTDMGLESPPHELFKINGDRYWFQQPERWLGLLSEIEHLRNEGWKISSSSEKLLKPIDISDADLSFDVDESEGDNWWFSLALNIVVQGKVMPLLPLLVSAVQQLPAGEKINDSVDALDNDGKFYGRLDNGQFVTLPFARVRSIIVALGEVLQRAENPDRVKASVLDLQGLFDETMFHSKWTGAQKMQDLLARLKRLGNPWEMQSPRMLRAELRPYQLEGVKWLQQLAREKFGGVLADDMGLGKTVELLAHICLEKENGRMSKPFLVICPTSVLPNWVSEVERFAPDLKILAFHGTDRWAKLSKFDDYDVVVTTYSLVSRDAEQLHKQRWHGVAVDEAQAIKNANTDIARVARGLKAEHRFCLTGTPVENNLGELWSQFQFALPGLLGDQKTFNTAIRHPIEKQGDVSRRAVLATRIRPFLIRRTKKEVATELPDKIISNHYIELDGDQRDLYETVRLATTEQVRDEIAKKGFKQSQIVILDALLKLRQVCCDPRLVKLSAARNVRGSAKLDALMEMITQCVSEGRKILLFSQFTSMLDLIAPELQERKIRYVELTGDTRHRSIPVKQFQNGNYPVFLLSLKAGGTGLNLTAADVVIHYDPWWNPAVEDQATDRAHRIGQDKQVFVYKFIARGTIEQRMIDLQLKKRALAAGIYDEQGGLSLALTEQDLMTLLNPIDEL